MKKKKIAIIAAVCVAVIGIGTAAVAGGRAFILGQRMQDIPQGKVLATVDGQKIYERDLEQIKLRNAESLKTTIRTMQSSSITNMSIEIQQQLAEDAERLQQSDMDILNHLIRQKVVMLECEKKGLLMPLEDAIKNQKDTIAQYRERIQKGEGEGVQNMLQTFLDQCRGAGLSEDEYIRQYAGKSAQYLFSNGNLYQNFLAKHYEGGAEDAEEQKLAAYDDYIDQLKALYDIKILQTLGTTKNTVSGMSIPSVNTTSQVSEQNGVESVQSDTRPGIMVGSMAPYIVSPIPDQNAVSGLPSGSVKD